MTLYFRTFPVIALVLMTGIFGCSQDDTESITAQGSPLTAGGSDEEAALQLGLNDVYDHTRKGARLILSYDAAANAFIGTVENTTNAILPQVRVEIHLSNGVELGPTPPVDLAPGEQIPITLRAEGPPFDKWVAHPEVGPTSSGGGEGSEGGGGEHPAGAEGGGN